MNIADRNGILTLKMGTTIAYFSSLGTLLSVKDWLKNSVSGLAITPAIAVINAGCRPSGSGDFVGIRCRSSVRVSSV